MNTRVCIWQKIVLLVFVTSISWTEIQAKQLIEIRSQSEVYENALRLREYPFVHHLFADVFYKTNLFEELSNDEMAYVLKTVLYSINDSNKVEVDVHLPKGNTAQFVFFISEDSLGRDVLAFVSNYHLKKKSFVRRLNVQTCYQQWYLLLNGLVVKPENEFCEEKEKQKRQNSILELVDFYLFDEKEDNDRLVGEYLDDVLNYKELDKLALFYANILQGAYYLKCNRIDLADKQLSNLKVLYKKFRNKGVSSRFAFLLLMVESEYEIMLYIKQENPQTASR